MKNFPDAGESWLQAEKMLDQHFNRKRIISWLLILLVPAIIGVGAFMYFSGPANDIVNKTAFNSNTAIENVADKSVTSHSGNPLNNNSSSETSKNSNLNSTQQKVTDHSSVNSQSHKSFVGNETKTNFEANNSTVKANVPANSNSTGLVKKDIKAGRNKKEIAAGAGVLVAGSNNSVVSPSTPLGQSSGFSSSEGNEDRSDVYVMESKYSALPVQEQSLTLNTDFSTKPSGIYYCGHVSFQASVYAGVNYISKTLSTSNDWDNYIQQRKDAEENIVTPAFGISLTATVKNLSLSLGAEYAVYGEKTNYQPYSMQNEIVENGDWNIYSVNYIDTDTAYVIGNQYFVSTQMSRLDSSFYSDTDTVQKYKYDSYIAEKNGVNHITYFEVPIMVSYNIISGRTGVGVSGGVAPGWLTKRSGYYLKPDGNGIESLQEIDGFRKFVMNGRVGLDFYYRMNARMCLNLRPQLKANLNSIFEDSYGVKQKYMSTGVLFGVSWMLN